MDDNAVLTPYLCGGTFFVILLQARAARKKARDKQKGGSDGLSDPDVMGGLIEIVTGNLPGVHLTSLRKSTSLYKECQINGDTYITFDQKATAQSFSDAIFNRYPEVFHRTSEFIERFIDPNKKEFLVKALLEIAKEDSDIDDDEFLFIVDKRKGLSKADLLEQTEIALEPLLIGFLHFILHKRGNDNVNGYATLESWGSKSPRTERNVRNYPFGASIVENITVPDIPEDYFDTQPCPSDDKSDDSDDDLYAPHPGKTALLCDPNGVAPDLSTLLDSPIFWIDADILGDIDEDEDHSVDEYLTNTKGKYEKLRTLLYSYEPRNFYDFYVCNTISRKIPVPGKRYTYTTKIYSNVTAKTLKECSNFIIITGTGGLGKSMMMRHLLLSAISTYQEDNILPIFVPLKNYDSNYNSVFDYVYEIFDSLGGNLCIDDFEDFLKAGNCLLLFDGLDEINSSFRQKFEMQLEAFTDRYPRNMYVMSTRPYIRLMSYQRFTVLELMPFNKSQALTLVDKLDFREDEPSIKRQFRDELDSTLYLTHKEFAQNPLLLTIMLMTYEQYAKIPSKMHKFYHEAYETLARKHDATKSAYSRSFKTKLDTDRFADYFAEFCAVTYYNQKYELTEEEFKDFFNNLIILEEDGKTIYYKDFLDDLCSGMCLMYPEGNKYHFTHRSFQEYFCALYFSRQMDENLLDIAMDAFEGKNSRPGDMTFSMLYDMIPKKAEKYIFIPFLKDLLTECQNKNGYWTYLSKIHPTIAYEHGSEDAVADNSPESYICGFILSLLKGIPSFDSSGFPFYEEFVTEEYVMYDENYRIGIDEDGDSYADPGDDPELRPRSDVDYEYIEEFGEPDVVGWDLEFDIDKVVKSPDSYSDLLSILDNDSFAFKKEYLQLQTYLAELEQKAETKRHGNLFDRLR